MEAVAADQLSWITTDPTRAMALADAHMVFAGGRVDARGSQVCCVFVRVCLYVCVYAACAVCVCFLLLLLRVRKSLRTACILLL